MSTYFYQMQFSKSLLAITLVKLLIDAFLLYHLFTTSGGGGLTYFVLLGYFELLAWFVIGATYLLYRRKWSQPLVSDGNRVLLYICLVPVGVLVLGLAL